MIRSKVTETSATQRSVAERIKMRIHEAIESYLDEIEESEIEGSEDRPLSDDETEAEFEAMLEELR
jgi:hypothetical protein